MTKTIVSQVEQVLLTHYSMSPGYLVGQISGLLNQKNDNCEHEIALVLTNSLPASNEAVLVAKKLMRLTF